MKRILVLVVAAAVAAGCGGSSNPPPAPTDVVISEVGNWDSSGTPAWIEVFNGTGAAVDLSAYTLRAPATDPWSDARVPESTFALPAVSLPAGGYAVVVGNVLGKRHDAGLLVHVSDANGRVPYWQESGFVELVKAGATVDFVRIGANATAPTTAGAWSGAGTVRFPGGSGKSNYALARRPVTVNTRSAADWTQVTFPTPGGPNDVAPGAVDSDSDGIPDSAKVAGGTFAGLDLYAMGARPGHRDIFIEVDAMTDTTDAGILPREDVLAIVAAKFVAKGVYLHFDAGARFSATVDPTHHNLGQTDWAVPYAPCIGFPQYAPEGCAGDLYVYKARHMALPRRGIFHYALFGNSQEVDGSDGSSGIADITGSNFIVTLGAWGFNTDTPEATNLLVNQMASTLMHEFGHNLGLRHGGTDNENGKPNFLSIMNYLYQLEGLPDPAAATAGDRYVREYFRTGTDRCLLDASPCGDPMRFRMDYSNGLGAPLDERSVSETIGLGRGGHWVDFDRSGILNDGYRQSLIPLRWRTDRPLGMVRDYNEWGNLQLPFQREGAWILGDPAVDALPVRFVPASAFNDSTREQMPETPPPPEYFASLRKAGLLR